MAKLTIFGKERERIDYYYPWFDGMSLPEQRRLLASVRQEIADEHAAIQAARPDRSQPDQPPPAKPAASSDASSSQQKKSKRRHYGSGRRRYRGWRRR